MRPQVSESPEARAAFSALRDDALAHLVRCASGVEPVERGFGHDVTVAAEVGASTVVPVITDGCFTPAP